MSQSKLSKPSDTRLNQLTLLGAVLVGAILRFVNIAKSSIWHDEGYTMMLAPQSPAQIWLRTARDVHPPLYYWALHFWVLVFGKSEIGARSLSAVAMLLVIVLIFDIVRQLFGNSAARLAAWFVAVGPFLVRYSQEARMYGLVAMWLTLATWLLLRAIRTNRNLDWGLYALAIAAALYTHYYSVFMIAVHWVYMASLTIWPTEKVTGSGLRNIKWWGANVLAAVLFTPWLPEAYSQFKRVQAAFWIPKVTVATIPSTVAQFLTFTDLGWFPLALRLAVFSGFVAIIAAAVWKNRSQLPSWVLIVTYTTLGPVAVFVLSYKRPIYVDRYFVFAAIGFYALLGVLMYWAWPWQNRVKLRQLSIVVLLIIFGVGIRDVYAQSNHQMRQLAAIVNARYRPGDGLISGELYTYFDFSYYNRTGRLAQLLSPNGVDGYGESSLLYDRANQIVIHNYSEMHPVTGEVWVIGKTGQHDYFTNVPATWTPDSQHYELGYVAAQRYHVATQVAANPVQ